MQNRRVVIVRVIIVVLLGFCIFKWWPSKPPITTSFRASAISGLVLQVQNTSDKYLSCKLSVLNETEQQNAVYSFSLDPYKMAEIGILEMNWTFMHGEKCLIKTEGYADLNFSVP
jgi:hypothetical protein